MSERWIRMIWDFRGEEAESIAKHHEEHLIEFAKGKGMDHETGTEKQSEQYCLAWIAVPEGNMIEVRDALKPHRGELHERKERH